MKCGCKAQDAWTCAELRDEFYQAEESCECYCHLTDEEFDDELLDSLDEDEEIEDE